MCPTLRELPTRDLALPSGHPGVMAVRSLTQGSPGPRAGPIAACEQPVRARGQEGMGLVEKKGGQKGGEVAWAAAYRGEREGRGKWPCRPQESQESTGLSADRRGRCRAANLHNPPPAGLAGKEWRETAGGPIPPQHRTTEHNRPAHAATELNTLKPPSENRNQRRRSPPEMVQKKKRNDINLRKEMEDKSLTEKRSR